MSQQTQEWDAVLRAANELAKHKECWSDPEHCNAIKRMRQIVDALDDDRQSSNEIVVTLTCKDEVTPVIDAILLKLKTLRNAL